MNTKKIYVTKEGLEDLKREHEELTKKKRPEVVARVAAAREMGDLSENAEYSAAREELAFIDGRIDELDEMLKQVALIDDKKKPNNHHVTIGSKVTIKHQKGHAIYHVVGEWEADPAQKKISHESPLGKALIGKKVGETVEIDAPAGKIAYTVVEIQ